MWKSMNRDDIVKEKYNLKINERKKERNECEREREKIKGGK